MALYLRYHWRAPEVRRRAAFGNWSIPYEAVLERVLHNWNPYETKYEADVSTFSLKYHRRRD